MIKKLSSTLVLLFLVSFPAFYAQDRIIIDIGIDTTKWAPVAYLSLIPDFNHLNTISNSQIILQSGISKSGYYEFSTEYLPEEEHLYRLHFSKQGDSPASLIIGGRNHNHFFLFARRNSTVKVRVSQGQKLVNNIIYKGYKTNLYIPYLNDRIESVDSIDRMGNNVNREYALETVYNDIKAFADTSSYPLLSLYALYNTDYENDYDLDPGFYRRFLRKWRSDKSLYFKEFRKSLRGERNTVWVPILLFILLSGIIILIFFLFNNRKKEEKKNPLTELTIQERKTLELMKQGMSNQEIADEFSVSISTVKSHVNSIYSKLGIKSRKEILNLDD